MSSLIRSFEPAYRVMRRPTEIIVIKTESDQALTFHQRATVAVRYGDTGPVRVILAAVSALVGLSTLAQPGVYEKFRIYEVMLRYLPQWGWGCLFLLAAAGLAWRLCEEKPRPKWGLAINALTFALYAGICLLRIIATRTLPPGDSAELILAFASFWALRRTKWPPDAPAHS